MQELNICIDIDGTVTEPYYWLSRANKYFNTHIRSEDVKIYEIHEILGIKEADYSDFYNVYGELLHKESKIRSGAKEVINKLFRNNNIHFITAREERMRTVTLEWLTAHQIPMDSIALLGHSNKVNKASALNCDIFIEDRYENAIQLADAGFKVLLIDCTYNRGTLPANATRVRHWHQIGRILENRTRNYSPNIFNEYKQAYN